MATGTTNNFNLTRNELIDIAYRKIGISANAALQTRGADLLNMIIREEDLKGTGQSKNLWALSESTLFLGAAGFIYTTNEGLDSAILDLVEVHYRNTSGEDMPVEIIDHSGYEAIQDKNATGSPCKVYLKKNLSLSSQVLFLDQAPASIGVTTEVIGSDVLNYQCIMGHTSTADNKPITGSNWRLYWKQAGSAGGVWALGSTYTNGELLRYLYKRPLFDFDLATDNPDIPSGWARYLVWRLAHDLCPEFDVDMESRQWLKAEYMEAREEVFNSTRTQIDTAHNRAMFF